MRAIFISILITVHTFFNLSGQNVESPLKGTLDGRRILEISNRALDLSQKNDSSYVQYFSKALHIADSLNNDLYRSIIFLHLGQAHKYNNDHIKAAEFFEKSIKLSADIQQNEVQTEAYIALAEILSSALNYDSAYSLLQRALAIAESYQLSTVYSKIGDNFNSRGQNPEAVEMYTQAVSLLLESDDSLRLASVYNSIGVVFIHSDQEVKAVDYFEKSLNYTKSNDFQQLLATYGNLGIAYKNLDSFDLAERFYNKCISTARKIGNEIELARNYYNLGILKAIQKKYSTAVIYYDSTEYYCRKNNIEYGLMILEISRSSLFRRMGEAQRAIQLGNSALRKLANHNLPYETSELMEVLYKANKDLGNAQEALLYHEKFVTLKDSLSDIKSLETIKKYEDLYEKEKSAKQISELEIKFLKEQAQKQLTIYVLIGVVLLLMILGNLFYSTKRNAKIYALMEREKFDHLKEKMNDKSKEATSKALLIAHLNENLENIRMKIRETLPNPNNTLDELLRDILKMIQRVKSNNAWDEFEENLSQVNEELYKKLISIAPDLTPTELKICGMIAQNLSSKDIAILINRSKQTIDNIRYTLRKKLNLEQEANLTAFIISL